MGTVNSDEMATALADVRAFRECLTDPHDFDAAMAALAAVVAEKTAEVERLREAYNQRVVEVKRWQAEQGRLIHARDQALGVVAAVKALADEAERRNAFGHAKVYVSDLRAVLGPVSGAVEGAGDDTDGGLCLVCGVVEGPCGHDVPVAEHEGAGDDPRPAELLATCIENEHDCYGSSTYISHSDDTEEDVACPCACHVAEHEQEVRADWVTEARERVAAALHGDAYEGCDPEARRDIDTAVAAVFAARPPEAR